MSQTVREVTQTALKLLGRGGNRGNIDENRESKYFSIAPTTCDSLQTELLICEGYDFDTLPLPPALTSLDDVLTVSDMTARRVMVQGMARDFAALDEDVNKVSFFGVKYENAKNQMSPVALQIVDSLGLLTDLNN